MGIRVFAAATALVLLFAVCLPLRTFALDSGEPMVKIVSCIYIFTDDPNVIVPLGTDPDDLRDYFEWVEDIAILKTEDGDIFFVPLTLDLDAIDTNTAGVYYPIKLELPEGAVFAEGLEFFSLGVHVVPTGAVDLAAISFYQSGYIVQWVHQAQNPVLWAAVDDGEWLEIPGESDNKAINMYGCFFSNGQIVPGGTATGLGLFGSNLAEGHVYNFQVQYDENQFSDILTLDLVDGSLPKATNASGGDRNGGDRGEDTLPPSPVPTPTPSTQPPPTPRPSTLPVRTAGGTAADITPEMLVSEPESAPEAMSLSVFNENLGDASGEKKEASVLSFQTAGRAQAEALSDAPVPAKYTDGHSVMISGERLAAMAAANPQYVSIILEGLRVSVPTAYILALGQRSSEPFTVTLYQPNDLSFAVAFSLGDTPLPDTFTQPFFVNIPWNGGPVSCKQASASGDSIEGSLDIVSGKASFALYQTGTYLLTKHAAAPLALRDEGYGTTQGEAAVSDTNAHTARGASLGTWRWPAILISLAVLLAAGASVIFIRRKSGVALWRLISHIGFTTRERTYRASGIHVKNE